MSPAGVILYGPPGSGKDTVTTALSELRPAYTLFQRLKAGPGRTSGYRLATAEHIEELSRTDKLLYRNSRYDAEYAIDRGGLSEMFAAGQLPVLHMGQVAGIGAVEQYAARWLRILLWCPQEVTEERCLARGDKDVGARLKVWSETRRDLLDHSGTLWSLIAETHRSTPEETAQTIDALVSSGVDGASRRVTEVVA